MLATIGRFVAAGVLAGAFALWSAPALAQDATTGDQMNSGVVIAPDSAVQASTNAAPDEEAGAAAMAERFGRLRAQLDNAVAAPSAVTPPSVTQASTSVRPSSGVGTMTSRLPSSLDGVTTGVGVGDSSSPIQSRICQFDRGPRTGQRQDSLVLHPLGTPCGDGTSSGYIVAP